LTLHFPFPGRVWSTAARLPLDVVLKQTVLSGREFPTAAVLSLDESGLQQPVLHLYVSVLQQAVLFRDLCVCLFTSSLYYPRRALHGLQQPVLHLQTCLSVRANVLHLDVSVYKSESAAPHCRDLSTGAIVLLLDVSASIAFVVPVYIMCFFCAAPRSICLQEPVLHL
jgi:hypothetical protein